MLISKSPGASSATGAQSWSELSQQVPDPQKAEARRRRAQGATLAELARSYDVSKATISRLTNSAIRAREKQ
jgi:DNA invertase Pin-like site-specific DNA recombinase